MNNKVYWICRKYFNKVVFFLKKTVYRVLLRCEEKFNLFGFQIDVLKKILLQAIFSSVLVFVFWGCDHLLINKFTFNPLSIDMVKDITLGCMSIVGVILGLYCANIGSIFSAKYTNVPKSISRLFWQDVVNDRCIKQTISYMSFCAMVLFRCSIDNDIYLVSLGVVLFMMIRVVITFSLAGNRPYVISDCFAIADIKFHDLFNTVQKVSGVNLFSNDISFQNHYNKLANRDMGVLSEIGQYNLSIPKSQNSAIALFMSEICTQIGIYWEVKRKIPFDSRWFEKTERYRQWHNVSEIEVSLALNTGTLVKPEEISDYYWFEDKMLDINQSCLEKLLKDDDACMLQRYFLNLCEISKEAGENLEHLYWSRYLGKISKQSLPLILKHSEEDIALSAVDMICLNYANVIVGINAYLSKLKLDDIFWDCLRNNGGNNIYINTKPCRELYTQIDTELSIEKLRITPDWFIEQMVANEIYKEIGKLVEAIVVCLSDVFDIGMYFYEKKNYQAALIAFSRIFELIEKANLSVKYVEKVLVILESKHLETEAVWNKVSSDKVKVEINRIKDKMPGFLMRCSGNYAVENWENRENSPDFLGLCYNFISDYLVRSIENNEFDRFEGIYRSYFGLVLMYHSFVMKDTNKQKLNSEQVFIYSAEPLVEYALISSLAIIWGEFAEDERWRKLVDESLDSFISKSEDNLIAITEIAKIMKERQKILFNGYRYGIRNQWIQRIKNSIVTDLRFQTAGGVLKTDSKLLSAFCNSRSYDNSIHFNQPEDVYMIVSVNRYLCDEEKYKSRSNWEKNL